MNGTSKIKLDYPIRTAVDSILLEHLKCNRFASNPKDSYPRQMMYTLNYEIRLHPNPLPAYAAASADRH
jgi:hypothetical protein